MVRFFCYLVGCWLFIPVAGWGQSTYEKGYFIDINDQKTECFIKPEAWSARGTLSYLLNYKDQPQTKPLAEISEISIHGAFNLKRANVQIDISGDESPLLSYTQEPEWHQEEIFLWTLVEGTTSLFLYEGGGLKRFFFRKGNGPIEQLVYKKYRTTAGINLNEAFKQTLSEKVNCGDSVLRYFELLTYTEKALIQHFVAENKCAGTNAQVYPKAQTSITLPDTSPAKVQEFAEPSKKLSIPAEPEAPSIVTSKDKIKYFGLEVNPLLRQIINLSPNSTPTNNPFGMQFASNSTKNGRGFSAGLAYSRTKFNDDNSGVPRETINRDIALRFGYERKHQLGKRWLVLHGYDFVVGGAKARTEASDQFSGNIITETTSNFWGVGPRAGILFLISDRVSLSTESTYYLRYTTDKTKLTGTPDSKQKTSELELTLPIVLILSIRF
ncbi:MAG: hypothetical protein KF763_08235 [Cyclobacteriaceae bacterium]|nr:hypothetical protein [Cyclobacteriaceae bacterium]